MPWQGFAEDFPGPHIWSGTPQDYDGQHVLTPDGPDWTFTQYVFPGVGIDATNSGSDTETTFVHGGGDIGRKEVRLMLESFGGQSCDTTAFDGKNRATLSAVVSERSKTN